MTFIKTGTVYVDVSYHKTEIELMCVGKLPDRKQWLELLAKSIFTPFFKYFCYLFVEVVLCPDNSSEFFPDCLKVVLFSCTDCFSIKTH